MRARMDPREGYPAYEPTPEDWADYGKYLDSLETKVDGSTRERRYKTEARRKWYAFWRTLRHSRRLLGIHTATFAGVVFHV